VSAIYTVYLVGFGPKSQSVRGLHLSIWHVAQCFAENVWKAGKVIVGKLNIEAVVDFLKQSTAQALDKYSF